MLVALVGCSDNKDVAMDDESSTDITDVSPTQADGEINEDATVEEPPVAPAYFGGDRPAVYALPFDYEQGLEMPLLISLHGYTGSSNWHDAYWGLSNLTREQGILLIMPQGRTNNDGASFWSATDACCNFNGASDTDDTYLRGLIEEAQRYFNIDTQRIGVMGHSNGGFMSYRMGCDHADLVTHVGALAGSSFDADGRCVPAKPVSVYNIHGTWDLIIRYYGRTNEIVPTSQRPACEEDTCPSELESCTSVEACQTLNACIQACSPGDPGQPCRNVCFAATTEEIGTLWTEYFMCSFNAGCYDSSPFFVGPYPSAETNVDWWSTNNECQSNRDLDRLDLDNNRPGRETTIKEFYDCKDGTNVRLATIERGSHGPALTSSFSSSLVEWFLATPRTE